MNLTQFSKYFNIPYRTIQNWDRGERQCPEYLLHLMEYKLKKENIIKDIKMQYHRKSIEKTSTDDNGKIPTYHTRCSECGVEVMCLDSVKEYLDSCPCCGAKLNK